MNARRRKGSIWYLVLIGIVSMVLVGALMSMQPQAGVLDVGIRSSALLGYVGLFLSIISSAYLRQMLSLFGRPFVKIHHILSIASLILITLHPLGLALRSMSLDVFVPDLTSWNRFLQLGGRPGWFIVIIAALAAWFRRHIRSSWRVIHILSYVAFLLITVHGLMIGTDTQFLVVRIVMIAMAVAATAVFVAKRLRRLGR